MKLGDPEHYIYLVKSLQGNIGTPDYNKKSLGLNTHLTRISKITKLNHNKFAKQYNSSTL